MIRKLTALAVSLALLCSSALPVFADGLPEEVDETVAADISAGIPAKSYILMEASTGKVLSESNADEQMAPASITKIMVMLLLMERIDAGTVTLDDMVTTSEHANSMGGTQIWLEVGEQMSVNDLLKATAVNSANDAAVALAEYMAGSEEAFAELMNQRAKELGMVNTTFKNATGLDADGHLSTARDIALMTQELLKHPKITEYTSIYMDSLRDGTTGLVNTNKMVRFYEGCNGMKTGTTDAAGSCLSCTATRDGMTLISVSMGSTTSKERFQSARTLLDHGFASYSLYTPELDPSLIPPIKVNGGQQGSVGVKIDSASSNIVIPKGGESQVQQEISLAEELDAPVEPDQVVGKVTYTLNGETIAELSIKAEQGVAPLDFKFAFLLLLRGFLGISQ